MLCLYTRGSTEEQQNTLAAQESTLRAYATYRQSPILGVFTDSGVSGSTRFLERPAVLQMLAAIERHHGAPGAFTPGAKSSAKPAVGIAVTKLDRAFRDTMDCLFTCEELRRRGIALHFLDLNIDTSTEVGELILTVMAAIAKLENRRRSTRQKEAGVAARQKGDWLGSTPYGWRDPNPPGTPKHLRLALVPDPAQQAILARLVTGDLSTLGDDAARRRLNTEGIPSPGAGKVFRRTMPGGRVKEWTCKGKWSVASVASVRKNPRLHTPLAPAA